MSSSISIDVHTQRVDAINLIFSDFKGGKLSWVLYENGTFVARDRTELSRDELISATNKVLDDNPIIAGTELGDFRVSAQKKKLSSGAIYIILLGTGEVMSVKIFPEDQPISSHIGIGLGARKDKELDTKDKKVVASSMDTVS